MVSIPEASAGADGGAGWGAWIIIVSIPEAAGACGGTAS